MNQPISVYQLVTQQFRRKNNMFDYSLFAFALLLSSAQAGPGLVPRYSNTSKSTQAGRYDMPLSWATGGFLSTIEFGTPKVQLPVFVDWTWISQFIVSPKCYGEYDPEACLFPTQKYWDPRDSSTFKNLSSKYKDRVWKPNHFFMTDPLHAEYGSDSIEVGPVTSDIVVQVSDMDFNVSSYGYAFPFEGVFGLSPVYKGDGQDYQSPFYQQWSQRLWKSPLTGFVYCYEDSKKSVCNGNDGLQSLGGIRSDLIKDSKIWWYKHKTYLDVNTLDFQYDPPLYNYWGIELESLKIGDEVQTIKPTSNISGKAAIFDHASYGRGIPLTPWSYDRLVELTQGVPIDLASPINNGGNDFYSVNCADVSSFPTVTYTFQGHAKEWSVTPEHYVEKVDNKTCVLNVRAMASEDKFIGNFGETFAKDKYIVFDFEKLRVGISDIKW